MCPAPLSLNVPHVSGPFLDFHEWDFRAVGNDELVTAILFEYTRSSHAAKTAIERWQSEPLNLEALGASFREITPDSTSAGVVVQPGMTHAEFIEWIFATTPGDELGKKRQSILEYLSTTAASVLPPNADPLIATRFSSFTNPWDNMKLALKPGNLSLRLLPPPLRRKALEEVLGRDVHISEIQKRLPTLRKHRLMIDWGVPADEIEEAVLEWARVARRQALRKIPRPGGNKPREVLLKFLATYRFMEAGFDFRECQAIVDAHRNKTRGLDSSSLVLPIYKSKGKWEDAACKAGGLLAVNFVKEIRSNFGYPLVDW